MSLLNTLIRSRQSRKNAVSLAARRATPRYVGMFDTLEERRLCSASPTRSFIPPGDEGGGGGGPVGVEEDQYEPNDSINDATWLPVGESRSATLHGLTSGNTDYFAVHADTNGLVLIELLGQTDTGSPLSLSIYNSSGTLLGTGTSSGTSKKLFSLGMTANQTVYAKVSGGKCGGYNISANAVSANFTWAMPNTFGAARDQWGLPIIDNTAGYARPNQIGIGGKTVSQFPVRLARLSNAGSSATYSWHVVGTAIDANNAAYAADFTGGDITVNMPNGKYDVTLTVSNNGQSVTSTQSITVRNYLLVAVGDSYSSGEGNPHETQAYDIFGFTTHGASWAQSGDDYQTKMSRMAHRSSKAAVAQAALDIENADPRTSVTFIFLSQSGARIDWGMLTTKDSAEEGQPGTLPSQMDLLRDTVGQRHIDALTMSIGGNDIGFGDIFGGLVDADAIYDPVTYLDDLEEVFTTAEGKIATLAGKYAQLNDRLKQFDIGQVFMTEYPDLTKDGHGNYTEYLGDIAPFMEADAGELKKAVERLMTPFVTTMHISAAKFGWTYVGGISDQFASGGFGGYGQIVRSAQQSIVQQGPMGWDGNVSNPLVVKETKGMMHPINAGLDIQKDAILDAWRKPELRIENWSVGSDAMLANPTNGYSFTVRNASFLATAGTNVAGIYCAPDAKVSAAGFKLTEMNVRALAPNETQSFSGLLPNQSDPFRTGTNAIYIGAVADSYNQINEANEVNTNPLAPTRFTSDKDVTSNGSYWNLNCPTLTLGGTPVFGAIGYDEIIGGYDVDSFRFNANSGDRVQFNVNSSDGLDTYIKLYRVVDNHYYIDPWSYNEVVYAANDNGAAPGETLSVQSFLDYKFTVGGEYAIQISHRANADASQMYAGMRQHGSYGHYSIYTSFVTDATPPKVTQSGYDFNTNRAWFKFDEDVNPSVAASVMKMIDRSHGNAAITNGASGVTYDAANKTIYFQLKNAGLVDADYRVTIPAGTFADSLGNKLATDTSVDLFVLAGDANHDRTVNFDDLVLVAQSYNKTGMTFAQGNIDRNAAGNVNFDDLVILAQQYNKKLTAPAAIEATPAKTSTPTKSPTRPGRIAELV